MPCLPVGSICVHTVAIKSGATKNHWGGENFCFLGAQTHPRSPSQKHKRQAMGEETDYLPIINTILYTESLWSHPLSYTSCSAATPSNLLIAWPAAITNNKHLQSAAVSGDIRQQLLEPPRWSSPAPNPSALMVCPKPRTAPHLLRQRRLQRALL